MCRKILPVLFILLEVFMVSCHEDVTVELPDYKNKLAVFCILEPEYEPVLFLNRSKSYFNYTDTSHELVYIDDALVIITDVTTGISDTLIPTYGAVNRKYAGYSTLYAPPHYYKGKAKSVTNHTYRLDIWHNGKHVNAMTKVPDAIKIHRANYTLHPESNIYFSIFIFKAYFNDIARESNAYFGAILNTSSSKSGFSFDNGSDGQEMVHDILLELSTPITQDSVRKNILIYNYTAETARYLKSVFDQQQSEDDMFTEPVTVKHNINGGLGIFGAVSTTSYYTIYIKRPK